MMDDGTLSRSPLVPWPCFCRLCFSWSAPLTTLKDSFGLLEPFCLGVYLHWVSKWFDHMTARFSCHKLKQTWKPDHPSEFLIGWGWGWHSPWNTHCSNFSSSLPCFPHGLTRTSFLMRCTWPELHIDSHLRICFPVLFVSKRGSNGWEWGWKEPKLWNLADSRFIRVSLLLLTCETFSKFKNFLSLSFLICKLGRIWPPREAVVRLDMSSAWFLAHCGCFTVCDWRGWD